MLDLLLGLVLCFKISTGNTGVFLPRIHYIRYIRYIRYVWALSPYLGPFGSCICAFLNCYILRKLKREDMRRKCPNIRVLRVQICAFSIITQLIIEMLAFSLAENGVIFGYIITSGEVIIAKAQRYFI